MRRSPARSQRRREPDCIGRCRASGPRQQAGSSPCPKPYRDGSRRPIRGQSRWGKAYTSIGCRAEAGAVICLRSAILPRPDDRTHRPGLRVCQLAPTARMRGAVSLLWLGLPCKSLRVNTTPASGAGAFQGQGRAGTRTAQPGNSIRSRVRCSNLPKLESAVCGVACMTPAERIEKAFNDALLIIADLH